MKYDNIEKVKNLDFDRLDMLVSERIGGEMIRGFFSWSFYGLAYRTIMRIAHKFNWHHMKPSYPDGDTMLWCHWCGIRIVTNRRKHIYKEINTAKQGASK